MTTYTITHVRVPKNDEREKAITHVKVSTGAVFTTREMVGRLSLGARAFVGSGFSSVRVHVYDGSYLRTEGDGSSSNNLLSLPRI